MAKYGIFGATDKEPPQLTMARSILGVGRDAANDKIKKIYREYASKWHPDKHHGKPTETEATHKMDFYASSYHLLTNTQKRDKAEADFSKALMQPFLIGNKVFCLGSLYGVRIYIPQGNAAITDTRRMLAGKITDKKGAAFEKPCIIYGVRNSILESTLADHLEVYYNADINKTRLLEDFRKQGGGIQDCLTLETAFQNRKTGGLDDLPWITGNDQALSCFLDRDFEKAVKIMYLINGLVKENPVFMYRYGVCLEALAAQNKKKWSKWKKVVRKAINLYEKSLDKLEGRMVWEEQEDYLGRKKTIKVSKPESQLTILMQLADAYAEIGMSLKSRNVWAKVKKIDPDCYEAKEKGRHVLLALSMGAGRGIGILPKPR